MRTEPPDAGKILRRYEDPPLYARVASEAATPSASATIMFSSFVVLLLLSLPGEPMIVIIAGFAPNQS